MYDRLKRRKRKELATGLSPQSDRDPFWDINDLKYRGYHYLPEEGMEHKEYYSQGVFHHWVETPDGEVLYAEFVKDAPLSETSFFTWVDMGCPTAEDLNEVVLTPAYLRRLNEVSEEFSIPLTKWDQLVIAAKLSEPS